ncbi:MAG: RNA polymerase sigma factor [Deltaproteobacteria bacterium]|nr:RNA polymerase sigma factor [Deltaproteobacteria bacterium]
MKYLVVFNNKGEKTNQDATNMTDHYDRLPFLAEEAKGGSVEAANRIVSLLHKEVFRMIYYRIFSREDAEDLTQEVFIKMFKGMGKLDDTDKIRPWLFAIALNRVRDFKRWKSIERLFGRSYDELDKLSVEDSDPGAHMERMELIKNLQQFTDRLPGSEGEVFMLRFVDQLGIAEISSTLNKNESTVKTHLYRAIKKFRDDPFIQEMMKGGKV